MANVAKVTDKEIDELISFIKKCVKDAGCNGAVIGLSGGLDSAVVTKLATLALGKNVLNVFMPTDSTPKSDYDETKKFSDSVGSEYKVVKIQKAIDALSENDAPIDKGNYAARIRMAVLYNNARKKKYLVLGTSNKSEIMVGYFTKFGDGACDVSVLSEFYKTQVYEIAKKIEIPNEIINKTPTAGFWDGQTDEKELGISYEKLDVVLSNLESANNEISSLTGLPGNVIEDIRKKVQNSLHKRVLPVRPE